LKEFIYKKKGVPSNGSRNIHHQASEKLSLYQTHILEFSVMLIGS